MLVSNNPDDLSTPRHLGRCFSSTTGLLGGIVFTHTRPIRRLGDLLTGPGASSLGGGGRRIPLRLQPFPVPRHGGVIRSWVAGAAEDERQDHSAEAAHAGDEVDTDAGALITGHW